MSQQDLRWSARRGLRRWLRRRLLQLIGSSRNRARVEWLAYNLGYDVVPRTWTSPIPNLHALDPDIWERRSDLVGLAPMDARSQVDYLGSELSGYIAEFSPPARKEDAEPGRFYMENPSIGPVDADVLYAMVRRHKPRRLIEVGSGFSTLVIVEALARNRNEGAETEFVSIDPAPPAMLDGAMGAAELRKVSATDVPLHTFERLGAGDMLVLDTTHSVRIGGEVNYLVLEVLPRLATGVLVHFHDIFFPWEYPRAWIERGLYWSEQYLLQAFLAFNPTFKVLFAAHFLRQLEPERLGELVPAFRRTKSLPASLWMVRAS
jgi:predicted O-methyltransferase YrrM